MAEQSTLDGVLDAKTETGATGVLDPAGEKKFPGYTEHLKGDLKTNEELKSRLAKFGDSLDDLGMAALTMEDKLAKSVTVPGPDATSDEIKEFREKLGIPTNARDYALKGIEGLPKVPSETVSQTAEWFAEMAADTSLSKGQGQKLFKGLMEQIASTQQAENDRRVKERAEAESKLRGELLDRYEPSVATVRAAIAEHGGAEFAQYLRENDLDNHPGMIKFMISLMGRFTDGQLPKGGARGETAPKTDPSNAFDKNNWDLTESAKYFPKR